MHALILYGWASLDDCILTNPCAAQMGRELLVIFDMDHTMVSRRKAQGLGASLPC